MSKRQTTAFNRYTKVRNRVRDVCNMIEYFELSHELWLKRLNEIYDSDAYKKLRLTDKAEIRGIVNTYDSFWHRHFLEWRLYDEKGEPRLVNGLLTFDYSVCEKRQKAGLPIGRHFWKKSNGTKVFY